MDLILRVNRHPADGETVSASKYMLSPGGKGANQAFAAGRCGAKTALVGCVGDDELGRRTVNNLKRNGVMTSGVTRTDQPTGLASVTVDETGQNRIIVASGANSRVSHEQVPDEILTARNSLLMQNELPAAEILALAKRAVTKVQKTIFNMAPFHNESLPVLEVIDILIVNETEAAACAAAVGIKHDPATPLETARALSEKYNITTIITLGPKGSLAVTADGKSYVVGAFDLENVVDTTGAGDAYCGTLAASVHAGTPLKDAMKLASAAGTLACTKEGTQSSYAYLGDIEALVKSEE